MIERILVAVDDSPTALAAAAMAIDLATSERSELHVVTVDDGNGSARRVLDHVRTLARRADLSPEITTADGDHPFEVILRLATEWAADVIVIGRSDRRRPGAAYVGSQTEHLLEFTRIPVLVVPDPTLDSMRDRY